MIREPGIEALTFDLSGTIAVRGESQPLGRKNLVEDFTRWKDLGVPFAVLTAEPLDGARQMLDALGVSQLLVSEGQLLSGYAHNRTAARRGVHMWQKKDGIMQLSAEWGLDPSQLLHIGDDMYNDRAAAEKTGAHFLGVPGTSQDLAERSFQQMIQNDPLDF